MKSSLKDEDSVRSQLEEIKIKMEEMENNKRNNLIVYGIPNDIRETHSSLHQKVCLHLRFSRYFFLAKAGDAHYQLFIGTILDIGYFQDQTPDSLQLATCKGKLGSLHPILNICHCVKDSNGISKLPLIQLILPYKISCICGSSEIPLLSLNVSRSPG